MSRTVRWLVALLLLAPLGFAAPRLQAASLQAELEATTIGPFDTVGLVVYTTDGASIDQVDLSPLLNEFEVLGRSTSMETRFENGRQTQRVELRIELKPKRSGELVVPALAGGALSTAPLSLKVLDASDQATAVDGSQEVIVEYLAQPSDPYVQQQVTLTVRVLHRVALGQASLDEPSIDGAVVERIGGDQASTRIVGGYSYRVIERNYAFFAQRSGEFELPPIVLTTRSAPRSMFGQARLERFGSAPVRLNVRPRPASARDPWLPATAVELEQELSQAQARVGEPLTRTLRLRARGLSATQLPPLEIVDSSDWRSYGDRPTRAGSAVGADLIGTLEQKVAMIPQRAGELSLPAITVHWWNTATDQPEVATLPAQVISVAAALDGGPAAPVAPIATTRPEPAAVIDPAPTFGPISVAVLVLWPLSLVMVWWLSRRPAAATALPAAPAATEPAPLTALRMAIEVADAARSERALLALRASLAEGPQRAAVDGALSALGAHRHAPIPEPFPAAALRSVLDTTSKSRTASPNHSGPLPARLWPD